MTGTEYGLVEVAEQLFWMSSALRTPLDEPGMVLIVAEPTGVWHVSEQSQAQSKAPGSASDHLGTVKCHVTFRSEPLEVAPEDPGGHCWNDMFRHCMVAKGYPIPSRKSDRPGLEIPFDMMAALAGAERVVPFGEHLIVKGYSTALFPTSFEGDCMFWHFIHKNDGSRISFADKDICLAPQADPLTHLGRTHIQTARHIVGWTGSVTQRIGKYQPRNLQTKMGHLLVADELLMGDDEGAVDASYAIGPSGLSEPEPNSGFVLEKMTISAGYYVTMGGTFSRGQREFKTIIVETRYSKSLENLKERFVVLLDVDTRQAWLADGLSVLLHLVRTNLNYAQTNPHEVCLLKQQSHLKELQGGRGRAFETLIDGNNISLPVHRNSVANVANGENQGNEESIAVIDIAESMMHILEQILDQQADTKKESAGSWIRISPWEQLIGFDFRDIAKESRMIRPKETSLRKDAEGWIDLTRALNAPTLFGKGFGKLMEPADILSPGNKCTKCHWNSHVPVGHDYLMVSGSDIETITRERGSKMGGHWRVINKLYLNTPEGIFSSCQYLTQEVRQRRCQPRILQIMHGESPEEIQKREEVKPGRSLIRRLLSKRISKQPPNVLHDLNGKGLLLGISIKLLQKKGHRDTPASSSTTIKSPMPVSETKVPGPYDTSTNPSSRSQVAEASSTQASMSTTRNTNITEPSMLPSSSPHRKPASSRSDSASLNRQDRDYSAGERSDMGRGLSECATVI